MSLVVGMPRVRQVNYPRLGQLASLVATSSDCPLGRFDV